MWFVILFLWVIVLFSVSCGSSSVSSPSKDDILVESSSEEVVLVAEGSNGFENWSMKVTDGGKSVNVTNESGGVGSTYGCVVWYRLPDPPVPPGTEVDRKCGTVPENGTVTFTTKVPLCYYRFQIDWEHNRNHWPSKVIDNRDVPCPEPTPEGCIYGPWEKVKEEKNECKDGKQINFFYYERSVISGGEQCTDTRKKEREELPCPTPTPSPTPTPTPCTPVNVPVYGQLVCYAQNPWGNGNQPSDVCGYYGLIPLSKTEGVIEGSRFERDARLVVQHWGGADCGRGAQAYTFTEDVRNSDPFIQRGRGGLSYTLYCGCPR